MEETKQIEQNEELEKHNKKMKIIEKSLKTFGGAIIAILGIIFLIFCNNSGLSEAISYCVATVFLVFGLFSICLSFMLGKGVISFDVIGGCVISAFGILIYTKPSLLQDTLPVIIGATLLFLALTLIVDTILAYVRKDIKRAVIYTICDVLLVGLGVTIIVLNFKSEDLSFGRIFINVIIGVSFIVLGVSYIALTFLTVKPLIKKEKKEEVVDEVKKDDVVEVKEEAEILVIEEKDSKKKKPKKDKNKDKENEIVVKK